MSVAGCISCDERVPRGECSFSERLCGHHCNHAWSHDACCWCASPTPTETPAHE